MPLPNTSPDMSPIPTTVKSSVWMFMPSSRKCRLTDSQAPFAPTGTITAFFTVWAFMRPRISVLKSSRLSDQRMPPRATSPPRRCTPSVRGEDRKSTRLNSSHTVISYAVFCLKKKKKKKKKEHKKKKKKKKKKQKKMNKKK